MVVGCGSVTATQYLKRSTFAAAIASQQNGALAEQISSAY